MNAERFNTQEYGPTSPETKQSRPETAVALGQISLYEVIETNPAEESLRIKQTSEEVEQANNADLSQESLVQAPIFRKDEYGGFKLESHLPEGVIIGRFGGVSYDNDKSRDEFIASGRQIAQNIQNTLGDLQSLDKEGLTYEQIRAATGFLEPNFNIDDLKYLDSALKEVGAPLPREVYSMLGIDYTKRLCAEAKSHLTSEDLSDQDKSAILLELNRMRDSCGYDDPLRLEIANVTFDYLEDYDPSKEESPLPAYDSDALKKDLYDWLTYFAHQKEQGSNVFDGGADRVLTILCKNHETLGLKSEQYRQNIVESGVRYLNSYFELSRKPEHIQANFETYMNIESIKPGVAKYLEDELGVIDFGRYPEELLVDQYRFKDDVERPYGVLLYPRHDHNGAFHLDRPALQNLYEQLKPLGINLRISERDGKIGVARSLLRFDKKYGDEHKIAFAVLAGHGTENSIQFGDTSNEENDELRVEDLAGRGVQRAFSEGFFEKHPTIILDSCSTGAKEGIGQQISQIMNGELVAPDIPSNLIDIEVTRDSQGQLHFNVDYKYGEDVDRRYVAGKEMQD